MTVLSSFSSNLAVIDAQQNLKAKSRSSATLEQPIDPVDALSAKPDRSAALATPTAASAADLTPPPITASPLPGGGPCRSVTTQVQADIATPYRRPGHPVNPYTSLASAGDT